MIKRLNNFDFVSATLIPFDGMVLMRVRLALLRGVVSIVFGGVGPPNFTIAVTISLHLILTVDLVVLLALQLLQQQ